MLNELIAGVLFSSILLMIFALKSQSTKSTRKDFERESEIPLKEKLIYLETLNATRMKLWINRLQTYSVDGGVILVVSGDGKIYAGWLTQSTIQELSAEGYVYAENPEMKRWFRTGVRKNSSLGDIPYPTNILYCESGEQRRSLMERWERLAFISSDS